MKTLGVNIVLRFCIMLLFFFMANTAHAGCGVAFLTGAAPVVDGLISSGEWDDASTVKSGEPCLMYLPDLAPTAERQLSEVTTSLSENHEVTFKTKRDGSNFYIYIDVDDQSISESDDPYGERIVVLLDRNNDRGRAPKTDDFKIDYRYRRSDLGSDIFNWCVGTGSDPDDLLADRWNCNSTTTEAGPNKLENTGVTFARTNRSTPSPGYIVEIQIPFSVIGFTLPPTPDAISDMGMAFSVVNDMYFPTGEGGWYVSGVPFPESPNLHLNNVNDVMDSNTHTSWDEPENWGEAFLTGAGEMFFISRHPRPYLSSDIKVGFESAANFADAGSRPTSTTTNAKWYTYRPTDPCSVRLWAAINRIGHQIAIEERRVLFLWAEHGSNPQKWYFAHLTDSLEVNPGEIIKTTPGKQWSGVPADKANHPCLKAFILPKDLNHPTVTQEYLEDIGTEGDGINNAYKINAIRDAYGLQTNHEAQMNISKIDSTDCPAPVTCTDCIASTGISSFQLASTTLEGIQLAQHTTGHVVGRPGSAAGNDIPGFEYENYIVQIDAYGVAESPEGKNYHYVEPMGGVMEVVNLDYLLDKGELVLKFNVSNSDDMKRKIYLNKSIQPAGLDNRVAFEYQVSEVTFEKGESREVTATITDTLQIKKGWSVSLHGGLNNPTGNFGSNYDSGVSLGLDLEYQYNPFYAAELFLGYDSFDGKSGNPDIDVTHLSISGKRYFYLSPGVPFVHAGMGHYSFDPGTSEWGYNLGAGWQWNLTSKWAVEATAKYHTVNTSGSSTEFSTVHVGVRLRL